MQSKIIRPEVDFNAKKRVGGRQAMFHAGTDVSDQSSDEEDVLPARVGDMAARTCDSESNDDTVHSYFKRAIGARNMNHPDNSGMHRTTSSIARLSMVIRRSLRLSRRDTRTPKTVPSTLATPSHEQPPSGPLFTENSRDTRIEPSTIPGRLEEIIDNKRLNRTNKVKKLVRKTHWPPTHEIRSCLWKELCNNKDFSSSKRLYTDELAEFERINQGKTPRPQVLAEEGAVINNFDLKETGTLKLVRLLMVIERLRPEIVYAPLIYPLCALLLHYNDDDGDCFGCVNYLLNNKGYMLTTPVQWTASARTILALVKKHKGAAYNSLKKRIGTSDDGVLVQCIEDWPHWLFECLPLPYSCRIVDCYMVEGYKFLIRSAISIVYIWSKIHKTIKTHDDNIGNRTEDKIQAIRQELKQTARNIQISTGTFIETAVKIRNLQSSTITRLQNYYEDQIRKENIGQPRSIKKTRRTIFCEAFNSVIVDNDSAVELMSYMPARLQLLTPTLIYRLSKDGASFTHLWSKIEPSDQSILIIKTTTNDVFGAYLSSSWAERHDRKERTKSRYWGTGESYVFRLNKEMELPEIYQWVGAVADSAADSSPQYFMTATDRSLVIGSGGGDAIRISEELTHGMTGSSATFGSPALCSSESFQIYELEVFDVPSSD